MNTKLSDLEAALWKARRDVFSDDPAVVEAASAEIKRLRELVEQHPDEVRRRDQLRQNADRAFMRMWE